MNYVRNRASSLSFSLTTSLGKSGLAGAISPGLQGQRDANSNQDIIDEEVGHWWYLVIDPNGIRPREDASYGRGTKKGVGPGAADVRYSEGTLVCIYKRRTAGWSKWLSLENDGGWLFDVSPKDKKIRLLEVEVTTGNWMYECLAENMPLHAQKLLLRPVRGAHAATLCMRELVQIHEKVRPLNGKGAFLKLADGRGWVLDFVDGVQVLHQYQKPMSDLEAHSPSFARSTSDSPSNHSIRSISSGGYIAHNTTSSPEHASAGYNAGYSPSYAVGSSCPGSYSVGSSAASDAISRAASQPLPGFERNPWEPEHGRWEYVVVDTKGLSLRSKPNYDQAHKIPKRIEEGEVVVILERLASEGTTFLRLENPQGWCFDRQPGGRMPSRVRMAEVKVERGLFYYSVVADRGIALRARCSFSDLAKTGKGPLKGALVEVGERVRAGETTFLRLKDKSGWIFDERAGKIAVHGPIDMQVLPSYTMATVRTQSASFGNCSGGVHLLSSPTNQKWAITKLFLLHNSKVQAIQRCEVEGACWVLVKKGEGGIEGWAPTEAIMLEGSIVHESLKAYGSPGFRSALASPAQEALTVADGGWAVPRSPPKESLTPHLQAGLKPDLEEPSGAHKCLGCGLAITSFNAHTSCCKRCGHKWHEDNYRPSDSGPLLGWTVPPIK